ncbi:MarR family winged helix-turn-helix transcriptional regulator [Paucibacter sp. XJ19-41]|uniref:MarR family winged helix-turn-helix transcriptional regulator n=1 Tax=Paucibacter sp. XJ19-41 TaxID=2927824 RepID=UPI00234B2180|nr:MarR family transcriptional regulator [Paucibacter sp. XJ19-41]MDC6166611.1 MarR family transcriptional regulator [Paucibacter sp. XJ19-41]
MFEQEAGAAAALMQQATHAMARDIEKRLRQHRLTLAQQRVLAILSKGQALTPSSLSLALQLDAGATTRLLDRLLAKRLCQARCDNLDRRSVQLQLTELGQSALDETQGAVTAVLRDWFSAVDAAELAFVCGVLLRLLASRSGGVSTSPASK